MALLTFGNTPKVAVLRTKNGSIILDEVTAGRVNTYLRRLEAGNFGAAKSLPAGVSEVRMDFGPGYRVYYGREGRTIIILLGGGSKRTQNADIAVAVARWKRYKATK